MSGRIAAELDVLARGLFAQHGFDYIIMHVAGGRLRAASISFCSIAAALKNVFEPMRAIALLRAPTRTRGIGVGRAAIDYHGRASWICRCRPSADRARY